MKTARKILFFFVVFLFTENISAALPTPADSSAFDLFETEKLTLLKRISFEKTRIANDFRSSDSRFFSLVDSVSAFIMRQPVTKDKKNLYLSRLQMFLTNVNRYYSDSYFKSGTYIAILSYYPIMIEWDEKEDLTTNIKRYSAFTIKAARLIPNETSAEDFLTDYMNDNPDDVFRYAEEFDDRKFALPALEKAVKLAPESAKRYYTSGNTVSDILKTSRDPFVKKSLEIYNRYGLRSRAYLLLDEIVKNSLSTAAADSIGNHPEQMFNLQVGLCTRDDAPITYSSNRFLEMHSVEAMRKINLEALATGAGYSYEPFKQYSPEEMFQLLNYGFKETTPKTFPEYFEILRKKAKSIPISGIMIANMNKEKLKDFVIFCYKNKLLDQLLSLVNDSKKEYLLTLTTYEQKETPTPPVKTFMPQDYAANNKPEDQSLKSVIKARPPKPVAPDTLPVISTTLLRSPTAESKPGITETAVSQPIVAIVPPIVKKDTQFVTPSPTTESKHVITETPAVQPIVTSVPPVIKKDTQFVTPSPTTESKHVITETPAVQPIIASVPPAIKKDTQFVTSLPATESKPVITETPAVQPIIASVPPAIKKDTQLVTPSPTTESKHVITETPAVQPIIASVPPAIKKDTQFVTSFPATESKPVITETPVSQPITVSLPPTVKKDTQLLTTGKNANRSDVTTIAPVTNNAPSPVIAPPNLSTNSSAIAGSKNEPSKTAVIITTAPVIPLNKTNNLPVFSSSKTKSETAMPPVTSVSAIKDIVPAPIPEVIEPIKIVLDERTRAIMTLKKNILQTIQNIPVFINKDYAEEILLYAAQKEPDELFKKTSAFKGKFFCKKILEECAVNAPVSLKRYLYNPHEQVNYILQYSQNPIVKKIFDINPHLGYHSKPLILLDDIADGKLNPKDAITISTDPNELFSAVVKIISRPKYIGRYSINREMRDYSLRFIREINDKIATGAPQPFSSVESFGSSELYFLMLYGRDEVFTSTFNGLFNRFIQKLPKDNGEVFLVSVNYNQLRDFLSLCANYGTLEEFLTKFSPEAKKKLLQAYVAKLETEKDNLSTIVLVAEAVSNLTDNSMLIILQEAIKKEYERVKAAKDQIGISVYGVLSSIISGNAKVEVGWYKKIAQQFKISPATTLASSALFSEGVICAEQMYFYNDNDGRSSFINFMNSYKNQNAWVVEDRNSYVRIYSRQQKKVEILANKPGSEENGISAINDYFKENKLVPTVVVHRGHSFHTESTLERIPASTRLLFMGSCGGFYKISMALENAPEAHIISTKQVGTKAVNDVMLFALNENIRAGKDIDWNEFWDKMRERLGNNQYFGDYVPPHKNLEAIFIRAYYKILGI